MNNVTGVILQCAATMQENIKTTEESLAKTVSAISVYLATEKQKSEQLLEKLNNSADVLEKLNASTSAVLENAELINKKIASSCASIKIAEYAKTMLNDINENFTALVGRDSHEKERQIRRILDRLLSIDHQCAHLQTFPKPYKDIISLYCTKIESVFGALPRHALPQAHINVAPAESQIADEQAQNEKSIVEEILSAKPDINYWSSFFNK